MYLRYWLPAVVLFVAVIALATECGHEPGGEPFIGHENMNVR